VTTFKEQCQLKLWQTGTYIGTVSNVLDEIRTQFLYDRALEIRGVASLPDAEIMPAIAGSEWEILQPLIISRYWFWRVVNNACTFTGDHAFGKAFREIQISHDRMIGGTKLKDLRSDFITRGQISYYTSQGVILWSHETDTWVLNPLWDISTYTPTWSY